MDLRTPLRMVWQHWWLVLLVLMVTLGVGGLVTVRSAPRYESTVTFFVTMPSQGVSDAYQGGLFLQQRVKSYVDLLASDRLALAVVAENPVGLTADQIRSRVSARVERETVLLKATVTDTDQARSLRLTEALSDEFIKLVQKIETPPGAKQSPIKVEIISGPGVGPDPVSPRPVRDLTLAGLLGLLLGVGLAVLRGLADSTIRDGDQLEAATGVGLLGRIPFDSGARTAPLIIGDSARSVRAEAMRKLRTNLRFVDVQEPARVIAVTSAVQGEGKTTLSCNLAIALAEAGWRVLLVEADLRRPKVAEYLGLESEIGLTNVLIGEVAVEDVLQTWGERSLLVLPAGSVPPNPSELLGSKGMADLLRVFRETADIVLLDTAPLLAVADGVVVAVQADGALMVTRAGRTSRGQAAAAMAALRSVAARPLGCVLNMARTGRDDLHQYEMYQNLAPEPSVPAAAERVTSRPAHARAESMVAEPTQELTRIPR